jgi:hypothetical protein
MSIEWLRIDIALEAEARRVVRREMRDRREREERGLLVTETALCGYINRAFEQALQIENQGSMIEKAAAFLHFYQEIDVASSTSLSSCH